jgi:hypothetical protein
MGEITIPSWLQYNQKKAMLENPAHRKKEAHYVSIQYK